MQNGIPTPQYPEFEFKPEWEKYGGTLKDIDSKAIYFRAIVVYGFEGIEPELTPEISDFFNTVVKPDIDSQHARMNRKKNVQ